MTKQERDELDRLIATAPLTLYEFIARYWKVAVPTDEFINNWHIGAIAEHLTACYERQIRKLIINIYPRSSKSSITSVLFPAWVWTRKPTESFYCASYAQDLALRDAGFSRSLILSPEYAAAYPQVKMRPDVNSVSRFSNTAGGYRLSVGSGAQITGFGGSIRILDDPNDTKKTESEAIREGTNLWVTRTWATRFNNPKTDVSIIIQQRTHEHDVTGYLLEQELGYEVLKIPFRYTGQKYFTTLGTFDPREVDGELADSNRWDEESAKSTEKSLGTDASGQLQQDPIPKGGMWFSREPTEENGGIVTVIPNDLVYVRYWDKAFTAQGGAYTVGCLMGRDRDSNYYVVDIVRGQWSSHIRDQKIKQTADEDKEKYGAVRTWLEVEPGAMGRDSVAVLKKLLAPHPVWGDQVKEEKTLRADGLNSQWDAGNIKLIKAPWNTDYIIELQKFPNGTYKDQVDASSGAFNVLAKLVFY